MPLPFTRLCQSRTPLQPQLSSQSIVPVPLRRSSRLRSRHQSPGLRHESQVPLEQQSADPKSSQLVAATSDARAPISAPGPVSKPVSLAPERALLTRENLKAFERMAGHPGRDSEPIVPTLESEPFRSELGLYSSKATTTTSGASFKLVAFQNGIFSSANSKPPTNLTQLKTQISRHRENSVSPSESKFEALAHKIRMAPNEQTLVLQLSQLLNQYEAVNPRYNRIYDQKFTTFPKNVGFNNTLSAAKPDMVEGLEMLEFDPFPIYQQLGGAAVPSFDQNAVALPHIAGEWKGPSGNMVLAEAQAAYIGACMVYGRNKALSFTESPDPTGHAQVFTFTTDGTFLNTFAHYSSLGEGKVRYHQYPISSSLLTSSYAEFKRGRQQLRNLQDAAKEASERLRDALIKKWLADQESVEGCKVEKPDPMPVPAIVSTKVGARDQMKSFQKRRTAIVTIEEPSEVDHESNARKTRRKIRG